MANLRSVADIVQRLSQFGDGHPPLSAPSYDHSNHSTNKVFAGIESFRRHMTDEAWQMQQGMVLAGYELVGRRLLYDEVKVPVLLGKTNPVVFIMQDKREWDRTNGCCYDPSAHFEHVEVLRDRNDIFKLTICKDAQQQPEYHRQAAVDIDCHAWIVYYQPPIVCRLAPYVRPQHMIRTYHSLDPQVVPIYRSEGRLPRAILSGAMNQFYYPLRWRIRDDTARKRLPLVDVLPHPDYGANGVHTNAYMQQLSSYQVAICTSSLFGYALRKIMEATACGCRVITDLPTDEVLPEIDENLVRVSTDITHVELAAVLKKEITEYDPARQSRLVDKTVKFYDYRRLTSQLAEDIDSLRESYP